ncbi:hypothetical protein [Streptomyces sp. NPDC058657]|uniref:hypothetical protein n=1 Tax=unclassified Streptomyces TaxID=2593676 RepID=UPI00365C23AC
MRSLFRAAATTGIAAALTVLAAPVAQAAPPAETPCVTVSTSNTYGRGEISLCPQSDGATRVSGYVEDLKPGWWGETGDATCVGWDIRAGSASVDDVLVCPHFTSGSPKRAFDFVKQYSTQPTGAAFMTMRA